jgi:hypothetical protein
MGISHYEASMMAFSLAILTSSLGNCPNTSLSVRDLCQLPGSYGEDAFFNLMILLFVRRSINKERFSQRHFHIDMDM